MNCSQCNKPIKRRPPSWKNKCKRVFCSKKCFYEAGRIKRSCLKCKKIFFITKFNAKHGRGIYCSRKCVLSSIFNKEKNPRWNGGRRIQSGYIFLASPDHPYKSYSGYVAEHRLVMEKKISRYLLPSEVVHHIDGNRSNNKIENLQLFASGSDHRKAEAEIFIYVKKRFGTLEKLKEFVRLNEKV